MLRRRSSAPIAAWLAVAVTLTACLDGDAFTVDDQRVGPPTRTVDAGTAAGDHDPLIEELLDDDAPGVAWLVGDRDAAEVVAAGVADLEDGTPLRTDDVFRIASISKPMVAAALLSFVEAGDLGIDDRIADHLPDNVVTRIANADRATVRQMLQMTSGIPDYLDAETFWTAVEADPRTFWTPQEALAFASDLPAEHTPGTGFHYSNSNYVLAQLLIEGLSGRPLSEVLSETVFDPAGMTGCALETADTFAATTVRGYELDVHGELVDVTAVNDGVGLGDGGVLCDIQSLARFLPALFDGEILGAQMLDVMLAPATPGSDAYYGLGIDVDHDGAFGFTVGHEGGSSGFQGVLLYLPDDEVTVAILVNSLATEVHPDVADDLLERWYDAG